MTALSIDIVAVGRLKERFWREAADEYSKRLAAYLTLKVWEIDDKAPLALSDAETLAKEAKDIETCLTHQKLAHPLILLDSRGVMTSSEALAELLAQQEMSGQPKMTFIIGGSLGVDKSIALSADQRMSFGPITLPHNLARIVLLEQLYRACRINRNEPYHK
ncbi:MAG: 23S rRNA (pseudouridine(1915)-N(3))-methyltransferase RlmH [Coriobacteriales bacterium]|nr:23S rRNA (pseudouridine(1915)-N(3))-methyltransferase RlmH [Coriobacteriales bacterium]